MHRPGQPGLAMSSSLPHYAYVAADSRAHWKTDGAKAMKGSRFATILLLLMSAPLCIVRAADVVNGWSPAGTIIKIHSVYSFTYFKLSSTPNGCGHADFWALPVQDNASNRVKHTLLIAAYTAGKTVSLRCESSQLSDFEIVD
jgi:hypothetical protein